MLVHIKPLPAGKWHLSIYPSMPGCLSALLSPPACLEHQLQRNLCASVLPSFAVNHGGVVQKIISILKHFKNPFILISLPVWIHAYTDCLLICGSVVASFAKVVENVGILWVAPCGTNLKFRDNAHNWVLVFIDD